MRKLIASLTTASFLFSFVLAQPVLAAVELRRSATSLQQSLSPDIVPAAIGRVTSFQSFGGDQVVINIQDLHCHAEVQRNIATILRVLDERYGLKKVYIEGASGDLDTSWLEGIKDKTFRGEIVEALVGQGNSPAPNTMPSPPANPAC